VAGVVALGISSSSDAEQQRLTYTPQGPAGVAVMSDHSGQTDWDAIAAAAAATLPGEPVTVVRGLTPAGPWAPDADGYQELQVCRAGERASGGRCALQVDYYGGAVGSDVLVGTDALQALLPDLSPALLSQAQAVLEDGGALVAVPPGAAVTEVDLRLTRFEASRTAPSGRRW
jgi:putative ABC transport system permease protein